MRNSSESTCFAIGLDDTAGTDVFAGDDLGLLGLSAEDILERDRFVIDELRRHQVPTVMLLGGGYTSESHRLVATSVAAILEKHR
ncbi:MAG: hypothetical protein JSS49_08265 [Planctomycetes bacterium]|nr:hypothetical protein [Planctomycetota bacterium]